MPQLDTDILSIAYTDDGPTDAPPVLLLHGWPDDPQTWDHLREQLLAEGKRVIVPALRGCGGTVFRHADTPRSGQMSALVTDILDFASKLNLQKFSVVGHDWGGRIAYNLALVAPERVQRCVAMSFAGPVATSISRWASSRRATSGITGTWRPSVGRRPCAMTGANSRDSSGRPGRQAGSSTMRLSRARPRLSTIRTGPRW